MKFRIFLLLAMIPVLAGISFGQKKAGGDAAKPPETPAPNVVRNTAAFAEILLLKTELESEVESLLIDYTEEYPKIKEARFQLAALRKEMDRLLTVKSAESSKLTLALGKLIVRKIEVETDLWSLRNKYSDDHPDVKRAKRKLEIFESAIREILG